MNADPTLLLLLVSLMSLLVGVLAAYLYFQQQASRNYLKTNEVERNFVRRELHEQLRQDADLHYENLQEKTARELELNRAHVATETELLHVKEKLKSQQEEMKRLQAESLAAFERSAERLFQEKSERFTTQNATQLDGLLSPLKERIQGFEKQIERRFVEETRDRVSLRQEIKSLQQLNARISAEANNLAGALRGNTKTQGDWGEWQLLTLLESSGLQEGVHFRSQSSFRDEDGRQKRPDFIIDLPDDKQLVIDSKVSLTAYERYCSREENDTDGRKVDGLAHLRSLRQHIADLASKNYTRLYQINSPDYLLLFIPIEPAYGLALNTDRNIFLEALERNIVIVTPSTLLATLRTVSYIWKQENQQRNVLEIARQSGAMYDQFVSFTGELQKVGQRLDQAHASWSGAMRKLSTGGKRGATLVGRAEKIRGLGVKTKRKIDKKLLEEE